MLIDPVQEEKGESSYRVLRGGSWCNDAEDLVVSYRNYDLPGYRNSLLLGFRLVRSVKEKR
jgi:formylglycine-generating enzyme required for sulfatase activity